MNKLAEFLPDFMHFSTIDGANLILLLGLIMLLGSAAGKIFQKIKIPQVVGYIVIGIFLGLSGFQILSEKAIAALNPISTIALSFIGFLIGAELKISVIKKYGKQFIGILLLEAIVPFFVVSILVSIVSYLFTHDWNRSVSLGLVLGAISSATAPAATTDVLKENRTRGPLTTTVLGIVALDDAVALILYAISSTIASSLLGNSTLSSDAPKSSAAINFARQFASIAYDIFGSIALGSVFGFLLGRIIRHILKDEGRILSFSLATLLLCTGCAQILKLDNILASMSIGFFLVNFAGGKIKNTFNLVEKFTPPIYVLFFVLVGAKLNIWKVTVTTGIIALLYVICRTLGKSLGSILGAKITKAPKTVQKYLPFCLLSQAGVAIGLSIAAGRDFQSSIGSDIMLIITATTFIVQIIGPIFVKYGVTKAGECGLDVHEEDIMKNTCVCDITCAGEKICNSQSNAILSEQTTLKEIIDSISTSHNQNYVVRSSEGNFLGLITINHLKESFAMMEFSEGILATDIMEDCNVFVTPQTLITDLMEKFTQTDTDALPIIDGNGKLFGIAEKFAIEHFLHAKIVETQHKLATLG